MELIAHPVIPQKKPVLVCILDGWGENEIKDQYNACHVAVTPTMDALAAKGSSYYRSVMAHGIAVGLPTDADMGNSEVRSELPVPSRLLLEGAEGVVCSRSLQGLFDDRRACAVPRGGW